MFGRWWRWPAAAGWWVLCEGVEGEEVGDEEGEEHDDVEEGVADRRRLEFHRSVADLERQSPSLPARWSRGASGEEELNLMEMLTQLERP